MMICTLTNNVVAQCRVTLLLFVPLSVSPLLTLTTVLFLSCARINGHLAMMLMALTTRRQTRFLVTSSIPLTGGAGGAELFGGGRVEQRLHDGLGAADIARRGGAHLHEAPPHRVLVIHGVKRHDALHVRRRQPQDFSALGHVAVGNPATRLLHEP